VDFAEEMEDGLGDKRGLDISRQGTRIGDKGRLDKKGESLGKKVADCAKAVEVDV
jgi:hypothetical protein